MRNTSAITLVEDNVSYEKRLHRSRFFKTEYPDSVPIFLKYGEARVIHRYIIPRDNNFGHLLVAFRRKLTLKSTSGLISMVEKVCEDGDVHSFQVSISSTIGKLEHDYVHKDGFLYIHITIENVFG
jgi:hypothetical protein